MKKPHTIYNHRFIYIVYDFDAHSSAISDFEWAFFDHFIAHCKWINISVSWLWLSNEFHRMDSAAAVVVVITATYERTIAKRINTIFRYSTKRFLVKTHRHWRTYFVTFCQVKSNSEQKWQSNLWWIHFFTFKNCYYQSRIRLFSVRRCNNSTFEVRIIAGM